MVCGLDPGSLSGYPDAMSRTATDDLARLGDLEVQMRKLALERIRLIAAAQQQGLQVPQDISIVGFDDIPLARLTRPALSTIRQDIEMGAHHLVDLLVRRIGGEDAGSVQIAPELLVRESS